MYRDRAGKYAGIVSNSCQSRSESVVESRSEVATEEHHSDSVSESASSSNSGYLKLVWLFK